MGLFWANSKSSKSTTSRRTKYFHPFIQLPLCSYAQTNFSTTTLQLDTTMQYARNSKCTTVTDFSAIPQYFLRISIPGNCSSLLKMAGMDSKLAQQDMGTAWQNRVRWSTKHHFWLDGAHPENQGGIRNTHQAEGLTARAREQTQAWPTGKRTWEHNWQGLKRGEKLFCRGAVTFCQVWCDSEGGLSTPTSRHLPPPLACLTPARHDIREQNNLRWCQVQSSVAIT